jgi:hypothetical protein
VAWSWSLSLCGLLLCRLCWIGPSNATQGGSGNAIGHFGAIACALQLSDLSRMTAKDHDHAAVMFETVISGHGLGMLRDNQRAFMVTRFA